jgi:hypothetical protein
MMNEESFSRSAMRYPLLAILLALLLLISVRCVCLWAADTPIENILPQESFSSGWAMEDKVKRYTADNLYTYINGEAEMYMPFGFQILGTALYVKAGNPDAALAADVYKMGSPLDAFGIYSYYRDPEAEDARVGSEGFVDESQLMFYKDQYFVRLSASGSSNPERAVFVGCAEAIAGRIPGESARPKELEILKIPGIASGTEKYTALSVMGYAFFKRGLTAEAVLDRQPLKVFVIMDESEQASAKSLGSYTRYLREKGMTPETKNAKEGPTLISQEPLYKHVIVRQAGRYLLGVAGVVDPRAAAPLIARMQARIAKP